MKTVKAVIEGLGNCCTGGDLDVQWSQRVLDSGRRQDKSGRLHSGKPCDGHDLSTTLCRGAQFHCRPTEAPAAFQPVLCECGPACGACLDIGELLRSSGLQARPHWNNRDEWKDDDFAAHRKHSPVQRAPIPGSLAPSPTGGGQSNPGPYDHAESLDLQRLFCSMLRDGVTHVVMEVSSHALALGRISGCKFRTGVFHQFVPGPSWIFIRQWRSISP